MDRKFMPLMNVIIPMLVLVFPYNIWASHDTYNYNVGAFSSDNVSTNDNVSTHQDADLGSEFKSGETISSSAINAKFKKIQELLSKLITYNNLFTAPVKRIILYITSTSYSGNLGGTNGANAKCDSESIAKDIKNATGCSTIEAILESTNRTLVNFYPNHFKPVTKMNSDVASTWSDFINSNYTNASYGYDLGAQEQSIWSGSSGNTCSDWSSSYASATKGYISSTINFNNGSYTCSSNYRLLCGCY